jgi:L-rhamnonate dehydratase
MNRRSVLFGMVASGLACSGAASFASSIAAVCGGKPDCNGPLKIADLELIELQGQYETEAGINGQQQVNPLDIYDALRPGIYRDKPGGKKQVTTKAIYLRIRTTAGLDGLYGPIERDAAIVVREDLRPFLIGKNALAGESLWDEMYRSNRHSRAGFFIMAISAVDNALWDLRGRYYGVPVYQLLGGPTRDSVEVYASCLGFSLEPEAVRTRCLSLKKEGYRNQKWFMPGGDAAKR